MHNPITLKPFNRYERRGRHQPSPTLPFFPYMAHLTHLLLSFSRHDYFSESFRPSYAAHLHRTTDFLDPVIGYTPDTVRPLCFVDASGSGFRPLPCFRKDMSNICLSKTTPPVALNQTTSPNSGEISAPFFGNSHQYKPQIA